MVFGGLCDGRVYSGTTTFCEDGVLKSYVGDDISARAFIYNWSSEFFIVATVFYGFVVIVIDRINVFIGDVIFIYVCWLNVVGVIEP